MIVKGHDKLLEDISLKFMDSKGRESLSIDVKKGSTEVQASLKNIANGVYRLLLIGEKINASKAISVQH